MVGKVLPLRHSKTRTELKNHLMDGHGFCLEP